MKNVITPNNFIPAAALALGLALAPLHAAEDTATAGLLGEGYASASIGLVDLDGTSVDAHSMRLDLNRSYAPGIDARMEFGFTRSEAIRSQLFQGEHYTDTDIAAAVRAFTRHGRVSPYAEAGAGWTWFKLAGWRDDSFLWFAGAGAEIEVRNDITLTPFVRYSDRNDSFRGDTWNFGVRGHYALTPKLGLTASIDRDDDQNTQYALGATVKF